MIGLNLARPGEHLSLLCLGAHSDDIEIGAGGTILSLVSSGVDIEVHWCVATAAGDREAEAIGSAKAFLSERVTPSVQLGAFRDGYLPFQGEAVKTWVADLQQINPDLVLTHRRDDAHQDHRFIAELAWNTFRDNLILEFEIPKWDGDLGQPNFYVPLTADILARKICLLKENFGSQRSKQWFDDETFRGLARLRGVECRAPERYAEAFFMRKAVGQFD